MARSYPIHRTSFTLMLGYVYCLLLETLACCDCEMQNSNQNAVHVLEFVSKCNFGQFSCLFTSISCLTTGCSFTLICVQVYCLIFSHVHLHLCPFLLRIFSMGITKACVSCYVICANSFL